MTIKNFKKNKEKKEKKEKEVTTTKIDKVDMSIERENLIEEGETHMKKLKLHLKLKFLNYQKKLIE